MIRTILWKVASAVAVLWGAATVSFLTLHLVPGDPANVLLGGAAATSSGLREQIIAEYGFDDPVPVQYLRYLGKLLTGDLGQSYQQQLPVSTVIGEQLGATVELTVAATVVSVLLATVTATLTAGRRRPGVRGLTSGLELFALSMPAFWLGTLLLAVFSFRLGLFPVAGDAGPRALVLPTLTLALPIAGILAQTMRDGMDTALAQPFAVTARARGWASWRYAPGTRCGTPCCPRSRSPVGSSATCSAAPSWWRASSPAPVWGGSRWTRSTARTFRWWPASCWSPRWCSS